MRIINEITKNFRIVFRNISSLMLLILGPLTLILLIGFAYSGEGIHSIKLGIISNDFARLEPAIANFSSFADIERFNRSDECVQKLIYQEMHVCLEFSTSFTEDDDFPTGTLIFYYDNSRKALSEKLVDELSKFFGLEAEKISIDTAQGIFENIQNMVVYLHARSSDIDSLVKESAEIRISLLERRQKLIEIREQFLPVYDNMILLQEKINSTDENISVSYAEFKENVDMLNVQLDLLKTSLDGIEYPNITLNASNITYANYTVSNFTNLSLSLGNSIPDLSMLIDSIQSNLLSVTNQTDSAYNDIKSQKFEFDKAVSLVSLIKDMIDSDIDTSYLYSEKIRIGNEKMLLAQAELNKSITELTKLDPDNAEKLVKPFLENFEPVIPELKNIKVAFPGMLTIIIIFISLLFGNILTLSEINSKAFQRNLLAPVSKNIFLLGLIITNLVIVLFQVVILLVVAQVSFKIDVLSMLPYTSLIIVMLIVLFTFLGMVFAIFIRNEQTSILTTTFFALSFFLFSDAITPLETMPKTAALIASFNPFVLASEAFRKLLIFGIPYIAEELVVLGIYLAVFCTVLFFSSKKM